MVPLYPTDGRKLTRDMYSNENEGLLKFTEVFGPESQKMYKVPKKPLRTQILLHIVCPTL